jgi:hypothetical protein
MGLMRRPSPIGPMSLIGRICIHRREVELPAIVLTPQRIEHEHEHDTLRHADEVEKETGPEIEHAAPGVANFAVAGGGQETGADVVIDLIF